MKIIGLIASLFLSLHSIGQKSYYFSEAVPSVQQKVENIDAKYFGTYKTSEGLVYELDETGIYAISISVASMTRETIRESAKYDVRGGFIHGVVENDSIPCVLEGERYYFGVRNRDELLGATSRNTLTIDSKFKNIYYLNIHENGAFVPMKMAFEKRQMQISYFDYEFESTVFDNILNQKSVNSDLNELVILSPSEIEFQTLLENGIFPEKVIFKRSK